MNKLTAQIIAGVAGIWLAVALEYQAFADVYFVAPTPGRKILYLVLIGAVIGLINFFIKPALDIITFPLRLLTLGLFSLILDIGIVWAADILFQSLVIKGIIPLFWTTLIIVLLSSILPKIKGFKT